MQLFAHARLWCLVATLAAAGCASGAADSNGSGGTLPQTAAASSYARLHTATVGALDPNLIVATGFKAEVIATIPGARELVAASNGDLLVGTQGRTVALVPDADGSGGAGSPSTLVTLPQGPAAGITLGPNHTLYVGTETAVWKLPYTPGDRTEANYQRIAALRTGAVAPGSDGDVHHTTSVRVDGTTLFAGVGSSCNACTEVDPGRAAILSMGLSGENLHVYAKNVRNPMALAVNPQTWFLWAGGAGQDALPAGHPYEYFDAITEHPAGTSWGWPACEENRIAYTAGADCRATIVPHVELPAYSTIIGATFYPLAAGGRYAFPASYRGGLFLTAHGSWHRAPSGEPAVAPHVVYVPMSASGWDAATPVNWSDPTAQYRLFFSGFNVAGTANLRGRPTGIAAGPNGSLFVGDDLTGNIYRIRPN